jgi:hypothetical protein
LFDVDPSKIASAEAKMQQAKLEYEQVHSIINAEVCPIIIIIIII